jgi:hypothetical protein
MKSKLISKATKSRYEFNRAYKCYLEHSGKIHCSLCKYHHGENTDHECYGGYSDENIKYPNWKLVSKSKKQWMLKPMKITKSYSYKNHEYMHIKF